MRDVEAPAYVLVLRLKKYESRFLWACGVWTAFNICLQLVQKLQMCQEQSLIKLQHFFLSLRRSTGSSSCINTVIFVSSQSEHSLSRGCFFVPRPSRDSNHQEHFLLSLSLASLARSREGVPTQSRSFRVNNKAEADRVTVIVSTEKRVA